MKTVLLLLLTLISFYSAHINANSDDGWSLAKQATGSFQPSPRESPHLFQKNATHAILYGGWFERIAYNFGDSFYYNDIYYLDVTNPNLIKWTKVENLGSVAPTPRSIDCAVYSPIQNALYIYGGTTYTSDFEEITFYADSWVFHFSTQTWTQLSTAAPPGLRAGMGCAYINDYAIVTHGSQGLNLLFFDDTWSWHLPSNTWTNLSTSHNRASGRFQFEFDRIPGTVDFLLANGQVSTSTAASVYLTDVWVFHGATLQWEELDVSGVPQPVRDVAGYALTSSKYLLMAGGDAGLADLTIADTCKEPLDCEVRANPTDTNYFLKLRLNQGKADWDDADFDHSFPPVRKPAILIMEPYLYLVGGTGWDGQHGVGEIYNPYTWVIKLKDKYFE